MRGIGSSSPRADGSTATQSFTLDPFIGQLQTFTFDSRFQYITAVRWSQEWPYHSFDNIQVGTSFSAPEPSSLALLGLGIIGVGYMRRKACSACAAEIGSPVNAISSACLRPTARATATRGV